MSLIERHRGIVEPQHTYALKDIFYWQNQKEENSSDKESRTYHKYDG